MDEFTNVVCPRILVRPVLWPYTLKEQILRRIYPVD